MQLLFSVDLLCSYYVSHHDSNAIISKFWRYLENTSFENLDIIFWKISSTSVRVEEIWKGCWVDTKQAVAFNGLVCTCTASCKVRLSPQLVRVGNNRPNTCPFKYKRKLDLLEVSETAISPNAFPCLLDCHKLQQPLFVSQRIDKRLHPCSVAWPISIFHLNYNFVFHVWGLRVFWSLRKGI